MPTTTKMGIVYPSSTDLVKDGATAMGTISTTVDSKTGLVFISSTSFTGVSSISLPQGTFTTNFDDYKVIFKLSATGGAVTTLRTRTTGTDVTSADYYFGGNRQYTNVTTFSGYSGNAATSLTIAPISTAAYFAISLDVLRPMLAQNTVFLGQAFNSDGTNAALTFSGLEGTTGLRDSLTFIAASLTISGTVNVYGYNK